MALVVLIVVCQEITSPRLISHKYGYGKFCQEALIEHLQMNSQFCELVIGP